MIWSNAQNFKICIAVTCLCTSSAPKSASASQYGESLLSSKKRTLMSSENRNTQFESALYIVWHHRWPSYQLYPSLENLHSNYKITFFYL